MRYDGELNSTKFLRVLGPAITRGFLKLRFICRRMTWKRLAGVDGATTEKLASCMLSINF